MFQVLAIRTIHEKLLYFSPASDEKIICLARVFEPFAGLNPVQYNPYTEVEYIYVCLHNFLFVLFFFLKANFENIKV